MKKSEKIKKLAKWLGKSLDDLSACGKADCDCGCAWNPFTNIQDAWDLVQKLEEPSIYIEISKSSSMKDWACVIEDYRIKEINIEEIGNTAPEAICNAVLELIEGEVKSENEN